MSHIDDLIAEYWPGGVIYKRLDEIATLVRGNGMPKTDFTDTGVGAIHYGQIYTYYGTWTKQTLSKVSPETANRLAKVNPGDLIITNTSENLEDVGKAVAWLGDEQIVTGGHATVLKHNQDSRFLAYWLQTPEFHTQKRRLATGTKVIDVSANKLAGIKVPVPPLEVQREIVRILDTFTALEAELEAELEARRTQYEHYRKMLLTSSESNLAPMGKLLDMRAGRFIAAKEISSVQNADFPYPCYGGNGIRGFVSTFSHDGTFSLIGRQGALCGNVQQATGKFYATEHAVVVSPKQPMDEEWLYHMLTMMDLNQYKTKSAQPGLSVKRLEQVSMKSPSLPEQQYVGKILDSFDSLLHDISIGLPAEIEARRKQYEHYRDKLLTFEELPS